MKISNNGFNLIKSFEGCRLTAYKPVSTEKYYTIGYGHYGPDVKAGMKITQSQADDLLKKDVEKFEDYVNDLKLYLNQNQFDALVSFAYNCGPSNLKRLCQGRTNKEIADHIQAYNKAGSKVLAGLTRRRKAEYDLFVKPVSSLNNGDTNTSSIPKVNETEVNKAIETLANATINGYFGNGADVRKENIYKCVQTKVNQILKKEK